MQVIKEEEDYWIILYERFLIFWLFNAKTEKKVSCYYEWFDDFWIKEC